MLNPNTQYHSVPMGHGPGNRPHVSSSADHKSCPVLGLACFQRCVHRKHLDGIGLGAVVGWYVAQSACLACHAHERPYKDQRQKPDAWSSVCVTCPVCKKQVGRGMCFQYILDAGYTYEDILGDMGERLHKHMVSDTGCFTTYQPYLQ